MKLNTTFERQSNDNKQEVKNIRNINTTGFGELPPSASSSPHPNADPENLKKISQDTANRLGKMEGIQAGFVRITGIIHQNNSAMSK